MEHGSSSQEPDADLFVEDRNPRKSPSSPRQDRSPPDELDTSPIMTVQLLDQQLRLRDMEAEVELRDRQIRHLQDKLDQLVAHVESTERRNMRQFQHQSGMISELARDMDRITQRRRHSNSPPRTRRMGYRRR